MLVGNHRALLTGGGAGGSGMLAFSLANQVTLVPEHALGSATPTFTRASTAYVPCLGPNDVVTAVPTWTLCASGEARFWGARRIAQDSWSILDANGVPIVPANGASTTIVDAGGPFGYLSEGARSELLGTTNAIRRTMTDIGWVATNITVGAATGADGGANAAASLTAGAANGTILFTPGLAGAERSYAVWLKRVTGTGAISITGDGTNYTAITSQLNTSTYTKVEIDAGSVVPIVGIKMATQTDVIDADFNGLRAGTFYGPTPIPVGGSTATDVLSYPASGNIIGTSGTAYVEVTWINASAQQNIIDTQGGGGGYPMYIDSGKLRLYDGAVRNLGNIAVSSTIQKIATSWGGTVGNGFISGVLGSDSPATFDGDLNVGTTITVGGGAAGAGSIWGTVRHVNLWFPQLPNAQLTTKTTP